MAEKSGRFLYAGWWNHLGPLANADTHGGTFLKVSVLQILQEVIHVVVQVIQVHVINHFEGKSGEYGASYM